MNDRIAATPRIAIVWRGDAEARAAAAIEPGRLAAIFSALTAAGMTPEPCVFDEAWEGEVRKQLLQVDAALVWVNPIAAGRRREVLDRLLVEVAAAGVLVSARPDVILKMGAKSVLYSTRHLGWGSDVRLYADAGAFLAAFQTSLADGPRVLKQNRGNDGIGVWKVVRQDAGVIVQEAHADAQPLAMSLDAFLAEWSAHADAGGLVDQPYMPRLPEGMIRCYMSGGRLAGFGHHLVRALAPADAGPGGPRLYSGPDDPRFQRLRRRMEDEWTPAMAQTLGIDLADLPVIWDADFLLGPRGSDGRDSYVLCEINVSSVFPIPEEAPAAIAQTLRDRLSASSGNLAFQP